jgi:hypothetical protein
MKETMRIETFDRKNEEEKKVFDLRWTNISDFSKLLNLVWPRSELFLKFGSCVYIGNIACNNMDIIAPYFLTLANRNAQGIAVAGIITLNSKPM